MCECMCVCVCVSEHDTNTLAHIHRRWFVLQVDFYIEQSQADNHAVREAACACIAELGNKIDPDVVRKHVPRLLDCLYESFQDESWPVRDGVSVCACACACVLVGWLKLVGWSVGWVVEVGWLVG